jgi:hypothetical protein
MFYHFSSAEASIPLQILWGIPMSGTGFSPRAVTSITDVPGRDPAPPTIRSL